LAQLYDPVTLRDKERGATNREHDMTPNEVLAQAE
jgi:hypothetical protein